MQKLLDKQRVAFLKYLEKIRAYSDLTLKSYDETLKEALKVVEITQESSHICFNLMPYRIKIANLNAKTISKKLSAIRSFSKYLCDHNFQVLLKSDDTLKVAKTLPKPISHQHIMQAINMAEEKEKFIVLLLYTTGLRISELTSLKLSDIKEQWIRVLGKGNKHRDVPLLAEVKELKDKYLSQNSVKVFLFEKNGEKLSENSLRYIVNKVFRRVSLKVTPHQLRHSYATALLNGGAPIVDVSELLGHSSMATTQIYTKLGTTLKKKSYNRAHPLCGVDK